MASIKDLKRMCNTSECYKCDLLEWCEEDGRLFELPDAVDEIVDKWVAEHPVKTYAMDFFEKFPNAPKDSNGAPISCWKHIYGDGNDCGSGGCTECWNQPISEDR